MGYIARRYMAFVAMAECRTMSPITSHRTGTWTGDTDGRCFASMCFSPPVWFSSIKRALAKVVSKFAPDQQLRDVHLVETSSAMRDLQKAKLQPQADQLGCKLHWHDAIDDVPPSNGFSMILAHEFFDALPFHLLQVRFHVIATSRFAYCSYRKDKAVGKKS